MMQSNISGAKTTPRKAKKTAAESLAGSVADALRVSGVDLLAAGVSFAQTMSNDAADAIRARSPASALLRMKVQRGQAARLLDVATLMSADIFQDPLAVHKLVIEGLPAKRVRNYMSGFHTIGAGDVLDVMGISQRTMERTIGKDAVLDSNASDRFMRLATTTQHATEVLGSQEAAEKWLSTPAIGLDNNRPIDLLRTTEGTESVKTLLTRMDYGVYS